MGGATPNGAEGSAVSQSAVLDEDGQVLHTRDEVFTGTSGGWVSFKEPLPPELQDRAFVIEFRFLSDENDQVGAGWMIDDVVID